MRDQDTHPVQGQCPSRVVEFDAAGGDDELTHDIGMMKLRTTQWVAHAARMAEVRNEYTTFVKKTRKTRVEWPGCTMEDVITGF